MPSSSYIYKKPSAKDINTGDTSDKIAPILKKNFPNEHLNVGKPNPQTPDVTRTTADILGYSTEYPKPITNDKAWTNSPRNN